MFKPKVTIIDYGVGNLLSVQRALEKSGAEVVISSDPKKILKSSKVILPGVGAFPDGMKSLEKLGLTSVIQDYAAKNLPLLAICLGMELLFEQSSEFAPTNGLNLISGKVIPVPNRTLSGDRLRIPHIGWAKLEPAYEMNSWENTALSDVRVGSYTYFVHSYMAVPESRENLLATVSYGGHKIAAVVMKDNIIGCQFHPEKSAEVGLQILNRFCND